MTDLIPHYFMLCAVTAVIFSGCDQPSTQTRVIDQSMEMMRNIERELDIALVDMEVQDIDVSFDQGFTLDIPNQPGGNPLNPEVALYPYPSDFYLTPNTNSLTGYQVSISDQVALRTMPSLAFENQDGFSFLNKYRKILWAREKEVKAFHRAGEFQSLALARL